MTTNFKHINLFACGIRMYQWFGLVKPVITDCVYKYVENKE